jgi:energy-coupling factor transport system ATP-binding protein
MEMKEPIISFENYSFRYHLRQKEALSNINLKIQKGEFVIITGPSGSGKSTLCYSIIGLIPHFYSGEVTGGIISNTYNVSDTPISEITEKTGYISQRIETSLTTPYVFTDIAFPLEYRNYDKQTVCSKILSISNNLILKDLLHRNPNQISEGEKQKVVFACSTVMDPDIIIADEPLSNLDRKNRLMIFNVLEELKKRKKTIIVFTHNYEYYKTLATRIIEIKEGKISRDLPSKSFIKNSDENKKPHSFEIKNNTKSGKKDSIIEVEKLSFAFDTGFQIQDLNLNIKRNKIIGVVGDNGSGKTTFLKLLAGLLTKKEGNIRIDGKELESLKGYDIASIIGYVSQDPEKHFFEEKIIDEIAFVSQNIRKTVSNEEITLIMKESGLSSYKEYSPHSLSHGEKRRLAFLSSIYHNPDILLIDEITNGLDYDNKKWLVKQFVELKNKGKTIIIISHEWEWLREFVDEILYFVDGAIQSQMDKDIFLKLSEEEFKDNFNSIKEVKQWE